MSTSQAEPRMTQKQFELQSLDLAREFLAVLHGRRLSTGVILQAAMEVHRCIARQLPPEVQSDISMGMAAYAGELLQGLPAFDSTQSNTKH
ncbi:hypothetical protein [Comamonas thiooxydans]|uniref:hypothetical protein n=1 Tax=Comamonas thiooxydans TaxID=363952 RepID=UPI0015A758EF|nr:hypothetical protein [Comamonas thiooxydans]